MSRDHRRLKKEQRGGVIKQTRKRSVSKSSATPRATNQVLEAGNTAIANLLTNLSGGKRLEAGIQSEMETAYGADFDNVRVHDDESARFRAEDVSARAFTQGEHIFLGPDAPSLQSSSGRKLLAHELAHVVQKQRAGTQQTGTLSREGDDLEKAADNAAARATAGQRVNISANEVPPAIQRQDTSLIEKFIEKGLQKGISYTQDGWAFGGVKAKDVEKGLDVLAKVLKGDIKGAIEVIDPKDPEEAKRLEQKLRKLKQLMEPFKPPEEEKREAEEERQRREELISGLAKRVPRPETESEPKFGEGFTIGPTTDYVVDDFDVGKSTLKTTHKTTLRDIADRAISTPNAEIEIVGHTDSTGEDSVNQPLSENRAKAVRDYLIGRGVESGKIKTATGRGMEEPLVEENTKADRAKNRRVEIKYWAGAVKKQKKTFNFGLGKLKLD